MLGLVLAGCLPLAAGATGVEDHRTILQVSVSDEDSGSTRIALWSLEELCELPMTQLRTSTPWTEGPQKFDGVSVDVLLDEMDVAEGMVELWARNDYSITTTVTHLRESGALLAISRNGEFMSPRDKGPIWVVFAYDDAPELRTESIYALSVWQLDRIRISR